MSTGDSQASQSTFVNTTPSVNSKCWIPYETLAKGTPGAISTDASLPGWFSGVDKASQKTVYWRIDDKGNHVDATWDRPISIPLPSAYTALARRSITNHIDTIKKHGFVVCAESKTKYMGFKTVRAVGEVGKVTDFRGTTNRRVNVEWTGQDREGNQLTTGSKGWTKCRISAHAPPLRRRMAQREFSSRRDSPVMTRLLQEIIAAQDK